LSFNPARHLDLFGSVILPVMLILLGSRVIFGMAKPVPINPYRFKKYRSGLRVVSLAGVIANVLTAIVVGNSLGILVNFLYVKFPSLATSIFQQVVVNIVLLNIFLAIFNLIPIPPLDGSKVVASFLSWRAMNRYLSIERYGFIIIFAFLYLFSSFFWGIISPVIEIFYNASFIWQLFI
jgi:Zn-dependent protease